MAARRGTTWAASSSARFTTWHSASTPRISSPPLTRACSSFRSCDPLVRGGSCTAPVLALLSAFGFENAAVIVAASNQSSVLAAFVVSDTFRWLRRWAVVGVIAIVTPLSVVEAYADNMPEFHHLDR